MNWLKAVAITAGPRILGAVAGGISSWIFAKTKGAVVIDAEIAAQIVTAGFVGYASVHKAASSFVNPGDAAKLRLARAQKQAVEYGSVVKPAADDSKAVG